METIFKDIRYALRTLLKQPAFTLVIVITLSVGIAASATIFSVVDSVLLRPLPYPNPDRIVRWTWLLEKDESDAVTNLVFEYWRDHTQSFEAVGAYAETNSGFNLAGGAEPQRVRGLRVSQQFFQAVGIGPISGRSFSTEEDQPNGPDAAIISNNLWHNYFGGGPAIIGQQALLNGRAYTVVGVLPSDFKFEVPADIFLPLKTTADVRDNGQNTEVIARLRPGVSRAQAQAEVAALLPGFRNTYPKHLFPGERGLRLDSYQKTIVGDAGRMLWLLFGAAGLVLLIACVNVANLLLANGIGRKGEVAIRLALGGSRTRIISQLLIESWLLAMTSSVAGLGLAWWSLPILLALAPPSMPRLAEIHLNYHAVIFAILISFLTTLVIGVVPALRSTRFDLNETLKTSSGRSSGNRFDVRLRGLFVITEFAVSLVLLIGAALLIRSFMKLRAVDTGFDTKQVITAQASLTSESYKTTAQVWDFERQVLDRLSSTPGVVAVATVSNLPLERGLRDGIKFNDPSGPKTETVQIRAISPDYFRVLGIPLLHGRAFNDGDAPGTQPVAIINQLLAQRYWPDRDPVGASVSPGGKLLIVGVARDVREIGLDQPVAPTIYLPTPQLGNGLTVAMNGWFPSSWVVRSSGAVDVGGLFRQAVKEVDPQMPVTNVRMMSEVIDTTLVIRKFILFLMAVFAGVALLLAVIGVYAVMNQTVAQRTQEIGIRMALGAQMRDVVALILRKGVSLATVGIAIGLTAAFWLTKFIAKFLFGITPTDVLTFVGVAATLLLFALLACYVPARRATKVDPLKALRYE